MKKNIVVIGAGPAGLSFAFEILKKADEYNVIILEETDKIGGISRTIRHNGNYMDIGGHRFFSKDEDVVKWWLNILPMQNLQTFDDLILEREKTLKEGEIDPETQDDVMLLRQRVSRIFYKQKFFDYPIKMKFETFLNLGLIETIKAGFSYIFSTIFKRKEISLEDFYINRFGKQLYSMFFEGYTEKLWGRHPKDISPDWGKQRVKGLSVFGIIKDIFFKIFPFINHKVETSLIEEFMYPKFGPGQLWEAVAKKIEEMNGKILFNSRVVKLNYDNTKITSVIYLKDGSENVLDCDYVVSSMALKDLITSTNNIPNKINEIASNLPYRDFVTIGVLVEDLNLKNKTKINTYKERIPDCWIYVQDTNVKLGRIQFFNNWSPYLVKDYENTQWIGLEYFCAENDEFWNLSDEEILDFAAKELIKMKLINSKEEILDYHREKVKKAYPAYFDSYKDINEVIDFINNKIENLYCIGRNGQHRYNNMDHSMMTGFLAAKGIICQIDNKKEIWSVNTEESYHEKSG